MIAIVDAGIGNLRSVVRALEAAGGDRGGNVMVTADPDVVARADRVVMPGQGAFGDCANALGRHGGALGQSVRAHIDAGKPYLGICLGLQVLFESSEESPGCAGLGVLRGTVRRFAQSATLKVPHVGWNVVTPLARGVVWFPSNEWFYFLHSYVVVPGDDAMVAARTDHGGAFASAIVCDNVVAVQFHPEKSQQAGLALLRQWLSGAA